VEESIASGKPIPDVGIKNVGVSSVKGRRSYNEDMHGVEQLNYYSKGRTNRVLYVGVFDGHGNDSCAKFCANVFPKHVRYEKGKLRSLVKSAYTVVHNNHLN